MQRTQLNHESPSSSGVRRDSFPHPDDWLSTVYAADLLREASPPLIVQDPIWHVCDATIYTWSRPAEGNRGRRFSRIARSPSSTSGARKVSISYASELSNVGVA